MTDKLKQDEGKKAGDSRMNSRVRHSDDPICGNCGKPLSKHYHENEIYCNALTTGDIFTDEPLEERILDMINEKHPEIVEEVINEWKRENGHA